MTCIYTDQKTKCAPLMILESAEMTLMADKKFGIFQLKIYEQAQKYGKNLITN